MGEKICVEREILSEGLEVTPLAAVLAAICSLIAIVTIVIVSYGDVRRRREASRALVHEPSDTGNYGEPELL